MLADFNQAIVILQVVALNPDGSKTTGVTGTVRVYFVSGGETEVLSATALVDVGNSRLRYEWFPVSLAVGEYIVEYSLVDLDGMTTLVNEDLVVRDIAEQATLVDVRSRVTLIQDDMTIVKLFETGHWKIIDNQMIFYGADDVTPFLTFDLKDDGGLPSMVNVFERVPV